ncbi:MAG: hypothetical protein MJ252_12155 [archaeon]|nr:hypothetical protein [archaeon]
MSDRPIKFNPNGKYNLDFIDWNNEWERVGEIACKIENGEECSDPEEEARVRRHMEIEANKYGVDCKEFPLVPKSKIPIDKDCYICLKQFKRNSTVRKLPCGHMFDEQCLIPWFKSNSVCPVCRFNLKPEEEEEDQK